MENIPAKSLNSGGGLDANASKPSQVKDASHVRRRDTRDGINVVDKSVGYIRTLLATKQRPISIKFRKDCKMNNRKQIRL